LTDGWEQIQKNKKQKKEKKRRGKKGMTRFNSLSLSLSLTHSKAEMSQVSI